MDGRETVEEFNDGTYEQSATEFSKYLTKVLNGKKLKVINRWEKNWTGKIGETADVAD